MLGLVIFVLYKTYWHSTRPFEKSCPNSLSLSFSSLLLVIAICFSILCDPLVSGPCGSSPDATFGLLLGVFVVCSLALLGLLTFLSWKLCCVPWRTKAHYAGSSLSPTCVPEHRPLQPPPLLPSPQQPPVTMATEKVKDHVGSMGFLEAAVKISHTSPDIPTDVQLSMREHFLRRTQRMQRQTTEPASSTRLVTCTCMCDWDEPVGCDHSCVNMLRGTHEHACMCTQTGFKTQCHVTQRGNESHRSKKKAESANQKRPPCYSLCLQAAHTLNLSLMKAEKFNLRNWVSVRIIRINTADRVAVCLRAGHYVKANYMLSPFWEWVEEGGAEGDSAAPALAQLYIFVMLVSKCQTVSGCTWVCSTCDVAFTAGQTTFLGLLHKAEEQSSIHQTAVDPLV